MDTNYVPVKTKKVGNHLKLKSDDKQIAYYLKVQDVEELVVIPKFHNTFHGNLYYAKNKIIRFAKKQVTKKYGDIDNIESNDNCVVVWCFDDIKQHKLIVIYNIEYEDYDPVYGNAYKTNSFERLELQDFCVIL